MRAISKTLLAHDPVVPQRDLLLDTAAVAERLEVALGVGRPVTIDSCERLRATYRRGGRLRVLHEVRTDGERHLVAASTFPAIGRSERAFAESMRSAVPTAPLPPVAHDPELPAVFWVFPNDRKIAHLTVLGKGSPVLSQLLGRPCRPAPPTAYAPEKSAITACRDDDGGPLAFAKVYSTDAAPLVAAVHTAALAALPSDDSSLRLPRVLACSPAWRTLVVEAMAGRPLSELEGPALVAGFRSFGTALAHFHSLPLRQLEFRRLDVDRVRMAGAAIAELRPDVRGPARALVRELIDRRPPPTGCVCLHGDVHPRNAIVQGDSLALIDLDQVAAGPAAAELGSLFAWLRYQLCVGELSTTAVEELAAAVEDGYGSAASLPPTASLRWHTAAALLVERALRAVYRVRLQGLRNLRALLDDARELLE